MPKTNIEWPISNVHREKQVLRSARSPKAGPSLRALSRAPLRMTTPAASKTKKERRVGPTFASFTRIHQHESDALVILSPEGAKDLLLLFLSLWLWCQKQSRSFDSRAVARSAQDDNAGCLENKKGEKGGAVLPLFPSNPPTRERRACHPEPRRGEGPASSFPVLLALVPEAKQVLRCARCRALRSG